MKIKFDAVIFDLDGLLLDTEKIAQIAWGDGSKLFGYTIDNYTLKRMSGHSVEQRIKIIEGQIGNILNKELYLNKIENIYFSLIFKDNLLKEGAKDLLEYLKKFNKKIGLATSSRISIAEKLIRINGIENYFDTIIASEHVERNKPNPDIYLKCLELLKTTNTKCIALEDSENGIKASIAAGIKTILIPDISEVHEDIIKNTYMVINSLNDLMVFFKENL